MFAGLEQSPRLARSFRREARGRRDFDIEFFEGEVFGGGQATAEGDEAYGHQHSCKPNAAHDMT